MPTLLFEHLLAKYFIVAISLPTVYLKIPYITLFNEVGMTVQTSLADEEKKRRKKKKKIQFSSLSGSGCRRLFSKVFMHTGRESHIDSDGEG